VCAELAFLRSERCTEITGFHDFTAIRRVTQHTHFLKPRPRITRQYGYKHVFCQNVVSTTNCLSLCFGKNLTYLRIGQLRIGTFPVPPVKLCTGGIRHTAVSRAMLAAAAAAEYCRLCVWCWYFFSSENQTQSCTLSPDSNVRGGFNCRN
jgi:hypothetical protein